MTNQPTTTTRSASTQITEVVRSSPGVTSNIGTRGELSFKLRGREIGHLHGDHVAHFFFPPPLWRELQAAGRITHHPVFPGREGPAARAISSQEDVDDVLELLQRNYAEAERRRPADR